MNLFNLVNSDNQVATRWSPDHLVEKKAKLSFEPDEQPAEAEIQIARFWNCLLLDQNGTFMRMGI